MHERLTELWLDSAGERSFQFPFCAWLFAQGHTIVHLTRHCGMELGKDVITRNPRKQLCVYQLKDAKGSRVTLDWWRENIEPQLLSLCDTAVVHGAVKLGTKHKPYVVINGDLNEEVSAHIIAFNSLRALDVHLEVVVRGQLLEGFEALGTSFWPESDSINYRNVLGMFLATGQEMFPKEKLAIVLESLKTKKKRLSKAEALRLSSSSLLLTSLVLERFQQRKNHFAEFEAWIVCLANMLRLAIEGGLNESQIAVHRKIAVEAAMGALERLCDEVMTNPGCSQGSPFTDYQTRGARLTLVCGALATYGLWRRWRKESGSDRDVFIATYIKSKWKEFVIPGECAGSAIMAVALYLGLVSAKLDKENVLRRYVAGIVNNNHEPSRLSNDNSPRLRGLPSPYYGWDEASLLRLGLDERILPETFTNNAYTCLPFFDLLVRSNHKGMCLGVWSGITHLSHEEFKPALAKDRLLWKCEKGRSESTLIPRRQRWPDVRASAANLAVPNWPEPLLSDPGAVMAFCMVYPHRLNADIARWLDEKSWDGR